MPKVAADKAIQLLGEGVDVRHYCAPCGDKAYRQVEVGFNEVQQTETEGRYEVYLNGEPVDLAYVYVEKDGKWSNVAKLCGLPVDGVPGANFR